MSEDYFKDFLVMLVRSGVIDDLQAVKVAEQLDALSVQPAGLLWRSFASQRTEAA